MASSNKTIQLIFFGTLTAYIIQNLFLFETNNGLQLFFLLLAFISVRFGGRFVPEREASQFAPVWLQRQPVRLGISITAVLLLFFSLYRWHILPLQASYHHQRAKETNDIAVWAEHTERSLALPVRFRGETAIFLAEQLVESKPAPGLMRQRESKRAALLLVQTLEEAGQSFPLNASYPVWAGQVYTLLGETVDSAYYSKAERNLNRARELAPRKQEIMFLLGKVYLLKKDFSRAIALHGEAVRLAPRIASSHWFFGLAYVISGDVEGGYAEIEQARQLGYSPRHDERLQIVSILQEAGKYDKLVMEYEALRREYQLDPEWVAKLGIAYAELGKKDEALGAFEDAIALYPEPNFKQAVEELIKKYRLK